MRPDQVWEELERRGTHIATVTFSGRSGQGGHVQAVTPAVLTDGRLVEQRLWEGNELACGLAGPVWDRYGTFVGHPAIRGIATWSVEERRVVISGERGHERFQEIVEWAPHKTDRSGDRSIAVAAVWREAHHGPPRHERPGGSPVFQYIGAVSAERESLRSV